MQIQKFLHGIFTIMDRALGNFTNFADNSRSCRLNFLIGGMSKTFNLGADPEHALDLGIFTTVG